MRWVKFFSILCLAGAIGLGAGVAPCEAKKKRSRYSVKPEEVRTTSSQSLLREWGVGLVIGDPTGVTVKYWQDNTRAYEFALGTNLGVAGIGVHADYLHHIYVFEDTPEAPVYVGGGVFLGGSNEFFTTGIRGTAGLAYMFEQPFDVFMQLSPQLAVVPEITFYITFSIGARVYL